MSFHRSVTAIGVALMLFASALSAVAQWNPRVDGYSQFRYVYSDNEGDGDFDTRRVRLGWHDQINDEGTEARFMIDIGDLISGDDDDSVDLTYAWVSHPFADDWRAQLGYGLLEFGREVSQSSSVRLPFERTRAAGAFFPGIFTLGLLVRYQAPETPMQVDLQVLDGMDAWGDAPEFDDAESYLARAKYEFAPGSVAGMTYMTSDVDVTAGDGASFSPDVWGAHVRYARTDTPGDWAVQAEYYDGDWYDHRNYEVHDADGWYAQLELRPTGSALTPFYRYDEFNYTETMTTAQENNNVQYSRHTLGVAYEPWEDNRFTFQVEDIDARSGDDTTLGIQWQVSYM